MTAISSHFDTQAETYDAATDGNAWTPNSHLRAVIRDISIPAKTGLDLGCGTGQSLSTVLERFPDIKMTGVDESPQMLRLARVKLGAQVELLRQDFSESLTAHASRFDLVTAIGSLEFVSDLPSLLREVLAIMADESHLIFTFEPLIAGLTGQSDRESVEGRRFTQEGITIFRWELGEILDVLASGRGRVVHASEFVGYSRGSDPVVYHLLHYARAAS